MKIRTTSFLCAVSCILVLNVYARGHKVHEVYDFQQFDNLTFNISIFNFTYTSDSIPFSQYVILNSRKCYVENAFTPYHEGVSQVRVVFPTENLKDIWGSEQYNIGFAVHCLEESFVNTNWYRFYQSGMEFDPTRKYTSFAMDVGECRRGFGSGVNSGSRYVDGMEILFRNGTKKSDQTSMGIKLFRTGNILRLKSNDICGTVNNFKTLYISDRP